MFARFERRHDMTDKCLLRITTIENCWGRWMLLALGWINVAAGIVGIFIPGIPTTVFLLAALWCFSRSSERFQLWLWNHPRLGPPLRAWHEHKVIPVRAKIMATSMMTLSFIYVAFFVASDWVLPGVMAGVMIPAASYVVSRSSRIPQAEASS